MDEYLFFQEHKRCLQESSSVLSPKIFSNKAEVPNYGFTSTGGAPKVRFSSSPKMAKKDVPFKPTKPRQPMVSQSIELNDETMQDNLKDLSSKYQDQFTSSGFPPKICTLLLNEISGINKLKCKVLDVGCGKGHVGEYLKQDGFLHVKGIDCSKTLLEAAQQTKAYEKLDKLVMGESKFGPEFQDKFDFVVSASMINNDGWDEKVFKQMLDFTRMGGFVIFATKLDLHQENQYGPEIQDLDSKQFWKFITEHTFYRYDKLCGNVGKFSTKKVKVLVYQKTDHNVWLQQTAAERAEEARLEAEREAVIKEKLRLKESKLNGAANEKMKRKMVKEQESSMALNAQQQATEEAEEAARKEKEHRETIQIKKKKMMKAMKAKVQEWMWAMLKENQRKEVERIEARRQEMVLKRAATKKLQETFNPAG